MKDFLDGDFLLQNSTGRLLFHDLAEQAPIIDYHCHLAPRDIAADRRFDNLTELWLGGGGYGDHYKWRLMRAWGVEERLITGDADDYAKFLAYAEVLPRAAGNPVHHWTHLELRRYFDCDLVLNRDNAPDIWKHCEQKLRDPALSAQGIIKRSGVIGLVTTDEPADDLEWHGEIAANTVFDVQVKPAWRPDKILHLDQAGFVDHLHQLSELCGTEIRDMAALQDALRSRMDHFDRLGCCAADHGLERVAAVSATAGELDAILAARLNGNRPTARELSAYQYALMLFFGREYARRGWVMEIHYGALRNVNTQGFMRLGADAGYDAIAPDIRAGGLPMLLDALEQEGALPRTVLFSLDPGDNAMLGTVSGCFQRAGSRGHVQQGPAWWFNDTRDGVAAQLTAYANTAPLGNFLGMATDSRSLLSYTRHEYFRRILCNLVGGWVEAGEYPRDMELLGDMIRDICWRNAKVFFGF